MYTHTTHLHSQIYHSNGIASRQSVGDSNIHFLPVTQCDVHISQLVMHLSICKHLDISGIMGLTSLLCYSLEYIYKAAIYRTIYSQTATRDQIHRNIFRCLYWGLDCLDYPLRAVCFDQLFYSYTEVLCRFRLNSQCRHLILLCLYGVYCGS